MQARTLEKSVAVARDHARLERAAVAEEHEGHFDPGRARQLAIPTLLMAGSKTTSPELKRSLDSLRQALPHSTLRIFEGQEHNAMDTIPQEFAATLSAFLLDGRRDDNP